METKFDGIQPCDCIKPNCEFFAPNFNENGTSFSREELRQIVVVINKVLGEKKEVTKEIKGLQIQILEDEYGIDVEKMTTKQIKEVVSLLKAVLSNRS